MVYRHIYWGLLTVGPDKGNLLTDAVKEKNYLVKIVTPFSYETKEEADRDGMKYWFCVTDDKPILLGLHKDLDEMVEKGMEVPDDCPLRDQIRQEDWSRYRLIRLKEHAKVAKGDFEEKALRCGKPVGKDWKKLFPVYGVYQLQKVARSVIALPDVEEGERECRYR